MNVPPGTWTAEISAREGEQDRGVGEERPEVDRPPAAPRPDDHGRERGRRRRRASMKMPTAATSPPTRLRSSGPSPCPSRWSSVAGDRDRVPLLDRADEEDLAGRRRRRELAEDGQLAGDHGAMTTRNRPKQATAAQSGMAGRRPPPERQAPPAIPEERETERRADEHAVVARQRREPDEQPAERRTSGHGPRARAPPATARRRRAAGRARSCPAGP